MSSDDILTLEEVCAWLKLKKHYLYKLTSQQLIPHVKIGRHLRFRRIELEQWLTHQRTDTISVEKLSQSLEDVIRSR